MQGGNVPAAAAAEQSSSRGGAPQNTPSQAPSPGPAPPQQGGEDRAPSGPQQNGRCATLLHRAGQQLCLHMPFVCSALPDIHAPQLTEQHERMCDAGYVDTVIAHNVALCSRDNWVSHLASFPLCQIPIVTIRPLPNASQARRPVFAWMVTLSGSLAIAFRLLQGQGRGARQSAFCRARQPCAQGQAQSSHRQPPQEGPSSEEDGRPSPWRPLRYNCGSWQALSGQVVGLYLGVNERMGKTRLLYDLSRHVAPLSCKQYT